MSLRRVPLLLLALLLGPAGVLSAQEEAGHRVEPPSASDPVPAEAPPPDVSEPPSAPETPDTPVESPEAPAEPSSESPSGRRYAVPVDTPVEPHRQPPSRDRNPPPSGGGDDGGYVPPVEIESDELHEESAVTDGWPFGIGRSGRQEDGGALDLDVSPGRTQIYLDGQYLGIVDQYDGWPSYLWLEEGVYEIVFYLDGYRTLARRVDIHPGMTIKLDDRLEPGPSIRPEEFVGR